MSHKILLWLPPDVGFPNTISSLWGVSKDPFLKIMNTIYKYLRIVGDETNRKKNKIIQIRENLQR